jgi:hypothetical protein
MVTLTLEILEKIGVQEQIGHAFHGRMLTGMSLETLQPLQTTSGIQIPPRLFFQFLMKGRKTETLHNRLTTSVLSMKHTITALELELCR